MITYPDLEDLLDFRSQKQPILSFYLNTDRSRFSLDQSQVTARNLLRDGRQAVEKGSWSGKIREFLLSDLGRLEKYIQDDLGPGFPHRALAMFACTEAGLWRVFGLPQPVPSGLMMEPTPHIRRLTLILDQYHRFGVTILDSRGAELFEVYIGEIIRIENAFEPSGPASAFSTAVEHPGSADRGMSRRGEEETQKNFRRIADILFHQFHRRHYEYLVLGGKQQLLAQFENYLHPRLKERVAGYFPAEPFKTRPAAILDAVAAIEKKMETENDRQLVKQLVDMANAQGLAVLGLADVLRALQQGAVHQLVVETGWHKAGMICRPCDFLTLHGEACPSCGQPLNRASDIVDEAIEAAIRTGSIIEHVDSASGMDENGHVGAILRFRIS
jgi:peptide chain release factor subunit 1